MGLPGSLWARGTGPEWCLFQRKYDPLSRGRIARRPFPSPRDGSTPSTETFVGVRRRGRGPRPKAPRWPMRAPAPALGRRCLRSRARPWWAGVAQRLGEQDASTEGGPPGGEGGCRGSEGGDLLGGGPLSGCAIDLGWGAFQAVREVRDGGCFSCGARSEGGWGEKKERGD